ncbi:MAG: hypothetical protein JW709_05215 [Sedimentisphaerales bacterium]|nr:hypothetical protein [Sedimentisphaerales bacterium]
MNITRAKSIVVSIAVIVILLGIACFVSIINIGGNEVGVVEKKFGGGNLPSGRILATDGENGIQAKILGPGWHFFYWPWQYKITKTQVTEIQPGSVGLLQAADGRSLETGAIYAPEWDDPQKMLTAEYFLTDGQGYKGPQLSVLKPGKYRINPRLFTVTVTPVTNVKAGTVGVVKSNVGVRPAEMPADGLVEDNQRGIRKTILSPQEYYLNTKAYEVTMISTLKTTVGFLPSSVKGSDMDPIEVKSADGFTFPVDVRVIYHIEKENAPRVVATIGDGEMILTKMLMPAVRATFRNNAEKVKALDYVQQRSQQEIQSLDMIKEQMKSYGITIDAILIGNVGDEKSLGMLLKTQTDREIALQEQKTFEVQQAAAEKQKNLTRTRQQAEEEKRLATAEYGVKVAEQEKQKRIIEAQAEAEMVKLVAQAKADAYKLISEVLGNDNAALLEVMKLVAESNIRITPEVMVGSSNNSGTTDALMGTILKDMLSKEKETPTK